MSARRLHLPASPALSCPSSFFFESSGDHRDLHSFPTRRSSDLIAGRLDRALELGPLADDRGLASAVLRHRDLLRLDRFRQAIRSEEHTSELQSRRDLVCRLLLEKKNSHHAVLL